MAAAALVVVDNGSVKESVGDRVRRLQAEAKSLANDHVAALEQAMVDVVELAEQISQGGDAYKPGIRDVARRLVEDMDSRLLTIQAIQAR